MKLQEVKEYTAGEDIIPKTANPEKVSDGHHTFEELYEFRAALNAALFNEWSKNGKYDVHKSKKHEDGEFPFGKNTMFIVAAMLPDGQISNHYSIKECWDMFKIPETDKAKFEFDNHTPQDVLERLNNL